MRKLLLLTVGVALAHAFLLWALPATMRPVVQVSDLVPPVMASSFVTRTIAPPAVAPPAVPTATTEAPAKAPPAVKAKTTVVAVGNTPAVKKVMVKAGPTAPPTEAPAADAVLLTPPPPAAEPAADTPDSGTLQLAAASGLADTRTKSLGDPATQTTGTTSPAGGVNVSSTARQTSAVVPPAARLLYDGKGEEKGFMKYSAGGELVWAPDGTQYTAKLEITFLTARLRTWTSKGALGDTGLQPTRFGDKPRGAEKATHFQRDKGIISFSANNPDVPLQPGAQDKLSAILQLSALVAGAPARFGAGSSISFQAADAHRAELWQFRASGTESLELPGGTLNGFKLTKQPTVDFDQRIEVWLAPDMGYLPVRLRITETNGTYVDLLWRKTLKPE